MLVGASAYRNVDFEMITAYMKSRRICCTAAGRCTETGCRHAVYGAERSGSGKTVCQYISGIACELLQ